MFRNLGIGATAAVRRMLSRHAAQEAAQHPWLTPADALQVARDHMAPNRGAPRRVAGPRPGSILVYPDTGPRRTGLDTVRVGVTLARIQPPSRGRKGTAERGYYKCMEQNCYGLANQSAYADCSARCLCRFEPQSPTCAALRLARSVGRRTGGCPHGKCADGTCRDAYGNCGTIIHRPGVRRGDVLSPGCTWGSSIGVRDYPRVAACPAGTRFARWWRFGDRLRSICCRPMPMLAPRRIGGNCADSDADLTALQIPKESMP